MKKFVVSTVLGFASVSFVMAASTGFDTNQVSGGTTATFTNSAGQVFSAAKLADNLKTLRSTIEQTMPMIAAVGEQTNSNTANKSSSLTGKVEDFVSGAIKRDQNQTTAQNESASGKVVDALRGLLKTNSNNTAAASSTDQSTLQNLSKLNDQLKSVLPTLDQLNVTASSGASANGSVLTPTGR